MLKNRHGAPWWAAFTARLALFCMAFVLCSTAVAQEERTLNDLMGPSIAFPALEAPSGDALEGADATPSELEKEHDVDQSGLEQDATDIKVAPGREPPQEEPEAEPEAADEVSTSRPEASHGDSQLEKEPPAGQPILGREPSEAKQEPESGYLMGETEPLGRTDEFPFLESAKRTALAFLVVMALFCLAVWALKLITRRAPALLDQKAGRVVGRIYLNPKARLYLVKIADRILVVGASPTSIRLITEITDPDVVSEIERTRQEPAAAKPSFGSQLRQFQAKFSGAQQAAREEAKLEEHLSDIKDQMAKLKALIGGGEHEEEH